MNEYPPVLPLMLFAVTVPLFGFLQWRIWRADRVAAHRLFSKYKRGLWLLDHGSVWAFLRMGPSLAVTLVFFLVASIIPLVLPIGDVPLAVQDEWSLGGRLFVAFLTAAMLFAGLTIVVFFTGWPKAVIPPSLRDPPPMKQSGEPQR